VTGTSAPRDSRRRALRAVLLCLSFLGFVVSLYLTIMHYRGIVPPCQIVRGCETVQTSRYSVIAGVPVALLGTAFFTVMFYLGIGLLTGPGATLVRAYKLLAYAGALAVIPLFLIQAILLKAYCSYCLATEVIMLALWVGSFWLTPGERPGDRGQGPDRASPKA
jgi:uncharacterized membrane protein